MSRRPSDNIHIPVHEVRLTNMIVHIIWVDSAVEKSAILIILIANVDISFVLRNYLQSVTYYNLILNRLYCILYIRNC